LHGLVIEPARSRRLGCESKRTRLRRRWLLKAKVDRTQLHNGTSVSKQLHWHDVRATGLTWLAVERRSTTEIRDVTGHTQTSMTDR
jgi:hypothetical protein